MYAESDIQTDMSAAFNFLCYNSIERFCHESWQNWPDALLQNCKDDNNISRKWYTVTFFVISQNSMTKNSIILFCQCRGLVTNPDKTVLMLFFKILKMECEKYIFITISMLFYFSGYHLMCLLTTIAAYWPWQWQS